MTISPVLPVYKRSDFAVERGEGVYLYAEDGTRFLDFVAGIAVNSLGHCHPYLVEALKKQVETLWHASNIFTIPGQQKLGKRLSEISFADTAFFCNSGTEAMECGIKMVRRYHDVNGNPHKHRIITIEGAFHGRTIAAISASGKDKLVNGFEPLLPGFDHIPFGDHEALKAAINDETAAILVEPVMGEGGVKVIPDHCLVGLRKLCDEHGLLLFLDEVQCGVGRTGKFFAHEFAGIKPDIVAIAKGIGSGFPVGACLATEEAAKGMTVGTHGSTFGGNPLAMAVGNAVLDVILKDGFLDSVVKIGEYLKSELAKMTAEFPGLLKGVRGKGLLLGLELVAGIESKDFVAKLRENGLLTAAADENVVRFVPPLIINEGHVDDAMAILRKTCGEFIA
jgi:acetylornithine/N-succinyldiaminopimelate aminotransferase